MQPTVLHLEIDLVSYLAYGGRVGFNKFPDFFVQAFRIVVDS